MQQKCIAFLPRTGCKRINTAVGIPEKSAQKKAPRGAPFFGTQSKDQFLLPNRLRSFSFK
jgi:hypothetical protein